MEHMLAIGYRGVKEMTIRQVIAHVKVFPTDQCVNQRITVCTGPSSGCGTGSQLWGGGGGVV